MSVLTDEADAPTAAESVQSPAESSRIRKRRITLEVFAITLLLVAAGVALAHSWNRWMDPIIDVGRDLYVPTRLVAGDKLYRDIRYEFPPLAPYLLSIPVRLSDRLPMFIGIGIAVAAAAAITLYRLSLRQAGRSGAWAVTLLFICWNITSAGALNSTWILPYAFAATIGALFTLLYLSYLAKYLFRGRSDLHFAMAAGFGLLAAWTKLEFAVLVLVSAAVMALVHRIDLRRLAFAAAVAVASLTAVSLYFSDSKPGHSWLWDNVLDDALLISTPSRIFYQRVSGMSEWRPLLEQALVGAALFALMAGSLWLVDRIRSGQRRWVRFGGFVAGVAGVATASWFLANYRFFRAWTVLLPILLLYLAIRERRSPLFLLVLIAVLGNLRVFVNLMPFWYGAFYTVLLYPAIAVALFRWLPEKRLYRASTALLWLPLIAALSVQSILHQRDEFSRWRYPIETPKGMLYDLNPDRAAILGNFIRQPFVAPGEKMVLVPEGLALNYFMSRTTSISWFAFIPLENTSSVEMRIMEEFIATRPEWVIVVGRSFREFGSKGFGVDYDQSLWRYLQLDYAPYRWWQKPRFSLVVMKRRERPMPIENLLALGPRPVPAGD
ncbi:MAG: hypothetical protein WBX15_19525 [Thermoanaerobaculia bacterium]